MQLPRIWNGTAFENQPPLPPAIVAIEVPITLTTNYNLQLSDVGRLLACNKATQFVLGIPNDATVNFQPGSVIRFLQGGAGQIAFAPVSPCVTLSYLNKNKTLGLGARAILTKITTNIWSISGEITT